MTHKRYEKYIDTEEAWLGSHPSHWARKPLWTLFRRVKRQGFESEVLLSVYRDHGVIPKSSREDNFNKPSDDLSAYQLVESGDLAVNKMKAWQGSVAISKHRGIVSPAYHVYTSLHSENQRYLHYLMRCDRYITGYLTISKGIRVNQWDLQPEYHSRMPVLLPPLNEQLGIASFLDRETAKIDALIAEQQRLIELLQEKRQAVISHAVTKGLNPNTLMKDSGVEWLGEVPQHWAVCAVGYRYEVRLGKMLDEKRVTGQYLGPYLRNTDVQWETINTEDLPEMDFYPSEHDRYSLKEGDLLVCEGGEVGRSAIWQSSLPVYFYQKALHRLRPLNSSQDSPSFQLYIMRMACSKGVFEASSGKATINHLPAEAFRRYRFAYPPLSEQKGISEHLATACGEIRRLQQEASSLVAILQERRSALISVAVTGQIDVRGLVQEEAGQQ